MRIVRAVTLAAFGFPLLAHAQSGDSLQLGDRIRVRVMATRGTTNLFVGNVSRISPDTLVLAIPGGKGTIILPRASIGEVAISDGHQSHFTNLPFMAPLLAPALVLAALPYHGVHANAFRNQRYALIGLQLFTVGHSLARTPAERWRPVNSWLDRP